MSRQSWQAALQRVIQPEACVRQAYDRQLDKLGPTVLVK